LYAGWLLTVSEDNELLLPLDHLLIRVINQLLGLHVNLVDNRQAGGQIIKHLLQDLGNLLGLRVHGELLDLCKLLGGACCRQKGEDILVRSPGQISESIAKTDRGCVRGISDHKTQNPGTKIKTRAWVPGHGGGVSVEPIHFELPLLTTCAIIARVVNEKCKVLAQLISCPQLISWGQAQIWAKKREVVYLRNVYREPGS